MEPKIIIPEGTKEMTILTGTSPKLDTYRSCDFIGEMGSVLEFLRKSALSPVTSLIIISYEEGYIELILNRNSDLTMEYITSELTIAPEINALKINDASWKPAELAKFLRMNKQLLSSEHMTEMEKNIALLRDYTMTIENEIIKSEDTRANRDTKRRQAVKTNLPTDFYFRIPLIKGGEKELVRCEVDIDPDTFECILISEDLGQRIEDKRKAAMDDEINHLKAEFPAFPYLVK